MAMEIMIDVPLSQVRRALNFLAKMGLTVRDDPPRVIDPAARVWGEPVDGFALSIAPESDAVSVVLRNVGTATRTFVVPGWLAFFRIDIDAPPTPFGRQIVNPERQTERITATLAPGELTETQVPVGSLFSLRPGNTYRIAISCTPPDCGTVYSNTLANFCPPGTYQ